MGLHETTAYKMRGKEGFSEGVIRERFEGGEGFNISDTVNVYHQAAIRQIVRLLEKELRKTVFRGEGSGGDVGCIW